METLKLAPTEWAQRRLSGLSMEGCELLTEKTSPRDRALQETRERFLADIDPAGAKCLLDEMATEPDSYPGSFEWRTVRILEKIKSQSAIQGVTGDDVEAVATFPDHMIVWDLRGDRFFQVEYELSDAGEVTLGSVKGMESKLVVKGQEEQLMRFFKALLSEALLSDGDPLKAKGAVKIARHLVEFGTGDADEAATH